MSFLQLLFAPEMLFLRNALLIGALSSITLGIIGTFVVTKRISSIAGAISHAALGGVGIALFLERVLLWSFCSATWGAVVGAVISALLVGVVSLYAKEREDTIIGVMWALGMAIGLLFLDRTPGYVDWQGYLFGNILLLSTPEVYMTIILDFVVLIPVVIFFNPVLAMCFDGTFAELRGVRVKLIYLSLLVLTALTIVLMMNIVGIILVIALLTLPAATAGCFTRHLWSMMVVSGVLNWVFVTIGLLISFYYRMPSGPVIVVFAGLVYVCALIYHSLRVKKV